MVEVFFENIKNVSVVEVFLTTVGNATRAENTIRGARCRILPVRRSSILSPSLLSPSLIPPPILVLTLRSQHFFLFGRPNFRDAPNVAAVPRGRRSLKRL